MSTTTTTSSRRDHLVQTALELFCAHGMHGVGIDRVLAQAGVAKATLYKHFKGKDDLIHAALMLQDEVGRQGLIQAVESLSSDPAARFVGLAEIVGRGTEHGCVFVLAAQEFPDPAHSAHQAAKEHKRRIRVWIEGLARDAGVRAPEDAAARAQLVIDGLYCAAALGEEERTRATLVAERSLAGILRDLA